MRSKLYAPRLRALSRATALMAFGSMVAACSNDAMRFNDVLTTGATMTPNQHSIIHSGAAAQVFPGDPAQTVKLAKATASNAASSAIGSAVTNTGISISKPAVSAQPLTSRVASAARSMVPAMPSVPTLSKPSSNAASYIAPAIAAATTPTITKPSLAQQTNAPIVLAPRSTGPVALKMAGTDALATGSIGARTRINTAKPSERSGGWGNAGGTYVMARSGETLYNLSRRFGVPVEAIMKANNMSSASALSAGSRVLIPAYTYSSKTKVSAPDNHPVTKAVRASTGFQGQARGRIATPSARQVSSTKKVSNNAAEKPAVISAKTRSSGSHTVVSGDTLFGISRQYGVSSSDLIAANNLSGSTIRLGQRLVIPSGGRSARKAESPSIDQIKTGSIPASTRQQKVTSAKVVKPAYTAPSIKQRSTEKVSTPKQTSVGSFRWPTRGRVITKFGERQNGAVNDGIDISVPEGTPVKAAEAGTVIYSGSELADFGNLILVSHSGGWVSAYAHASQNNVKRGDKVGRGQVIAMSGRSGNAKVPKLHFELRKDSTPVNPLRHLAK